MLQRNRLLYLLSSILFLISQPLDRKKPAAACSICTQTTYSSETPSYTSTPIKVSPVVLDIAGDSTSIVNMAPVVSSRALEDPPVTPLSDHDAIDDRPPSASSRVLGIPSLDDVFQDAIPSPVSPISCSSSLMSFEDLAPITPEPPKEVLEADD